YEEYVHQQEMLEEIARRLKITSIGQTVEKVDLLVQDNSALNRTIGQLKNQIAAAQSGQLANDAEDINGLKVLVRAVEGNSSEARSLVESMMDHLKEGVVLLAIKNGDKVVFTAGCSQKAIEKGITASNLVRTAAQICGGNGGGRNDFASAGGKNAEKLDEALEAVKKLISA
ncbi:MAG: hypothetical protein IJI05_02900, partial [Erysipelotrichaceae bacterium]|nr:hypothetical protein [Erysipelotrichaceae bacterium]